MSLYVLLCMIFLHVIDDFVLQKMGCLADLKQKEWWKKQIPIPLKDSKYKFDYIPPLIFHAFSWVFMITLPVCYFFSFETMPMFYVIFAVNMVIHAFVDHLKANMLKINLCQDQLIHLVQIAATYIIFSTVYFEEWFNNV